MFSRTRMFDSTTESKILEESPSTLFTPETRAKMVSKVKSLVRNVTYESAGTGISCQ